MLAGFQRRALGLRASVAGKHRRRSDAGTARHRMRRRRRRVWRQPPGGQDHDLGRRRARPRGRRSGSAHPPIASAASRWSRISRFPAIPIFSPSAIPLRLQARTGSRSPASPRPPSSRALCRPMRSRRGLRGGTPAPFRYKHAGSLAQIGKRGGDRFRPHQAARRHRMVDMGHRPHLFPDRSAQPAQRRHELVVDRMSRDQRTARLITQGRAKSRGDDGEQGLTTGRSGLMDAWHLGVCAPATPAYKPSLCLEQHCSKNKQIRGKKSCCGHNREPEIRSSD